MPVSEYKKLQFLTNDRPTAVILDCSTKDRLTCELPIFVSQAENKMEYRRRRENLACRLTNFLSLTINELESIIN